MNEIKQADVMGHHKLRPYWHVDMKWVCSLVLVMLLGSWMLLVSAYHLTAPQTAIALTTNVLASMFSRGDLDNPGGVAELKTKAAASPTKSIQPISNFPVTVTENDLNTLSPHQLRLKIFGQIATPLYYKGPHTYAQELTTDPAQRQQFENDASLLGLITQSRHDMIGKLVVIVGLVAAVFLAGAMYFSAGFGRLVTPAVILTVVSAPGALVFSILQHWATIGGASSTGQDLGSILAAAHDGLVEPIMYAQRLYLVVLISAGVIVLIALAGKIVTSVIIHRKRSSVSS